jgi:hypothetical protein
MTILLEKYPSLPHRERKYRFIPTIDIDHAYAFGHRTLKRIIGGFLRNIRDADITSLAFRARVMMGRDKDPYDNYDLILNLHADYNLEPLWFILFADYRGEDNNVSLHDKNFRELVRKLNHQQKVGIHPSMASNRHTHLMRKEIADLSELINRDILLSRQHFLRVSFPKTYQHLTQYGITDDFSMGYASDPGFRASIADPFHFYDLITDQETKLVIHPITIMDVTFKDYIKLNRDQSIEQIQRMIDAVKEVKGEFVSLWHNESFSDRGRWKGWITVYEEMLKYATAS